MCARHGRWAGLPGTWPALSGSDRVSLSAFDSGSDTSISGDAAYSEDMGGEYRVPDGSRHARQRRPHTTSTHASHSPRREAHPADLTCALRGIGAGLFKEALTDRAVVRFMLQFVRDILSHAH